MKKYLLFTGILIIGLITFSHASSGFNSNFSGDNLGSHKASKDIDMRSNSIVDTAAIGVGTDTIHSSSLLDVVSTTKGSSPFPSMTTAQRDAISSPATGLQIYNTDRNFLERYDGDVWLNCQLVKMLNDQGATLSEGQWVKISTVTANAVDTLTSLQNNKVLGVIVEGGNDGEYVTIATSGFWNILFAANENVALSDWVATSNNGSGQSEVFNANGYGIYAGAIETGTDTSPFLVKCWIGNVCDKY